MMETFSSAPSRRAIQRSPASSDDSSTLPRSSLPMRSSSYTVNTTVHGLIAQPNEQQRFHSGSSELWTTSLWQVVSPTAIFTHGSDRSSRFRGLTLPSYQWSLCGMWRAASPHARSAGIRRDGVQPRPHRRRESHTQRWQAESHTSRGNLPTRRVAFPQDKACHWSPILCESRGRSSPGKAAASSAGFTGKHAFQRAGPDERRR